MASSIEAVIDSELFRDGALVKRTTHTCPRGYFVNGRQLCEAPRLSATNPAGLQDYVLKVVVTFTVSPDDFRRTARISSNGRY